MRVRASIAVLLLSAVALTACATPGDPASTSSRTPSASAEQTSTPSPAPTIDSDDPSTWIITDDGMGPITLGDPFPDALALMPEGTTNDVDNCAWTAWWNAPDQSYQVFTARAPTARTTLR
ncbi:hypothetical protein [Microbacterium jejuense]|uniref:hypothetical protein n=1 Tax=Microbacterium jejuense TaxID=1263637 RepID=UPI0031F1921D